MQHDLPGSAAKTPHVIENQTLNLFGQRLTLKVIPDHESRKRLTQHYETYLSSTTLEQTGVAIDVGAGAGEFAIPFAKAFPNWMVWCFEPDRDQFALLKENVEAHGVGNIRLACVAVGGEAADGTEELVKLLEANVDLETEAACPKAEFVLRKTGSHLRSGSEAGAEDLETVMVPRVAPEALIALQPTLLKMTAPGAEARILQGLADAELNHVIGELKELIPSSLIFRSDAKGNRRANLPLASEGSLALRRQQDLHKRRPGLDVVIAMYNTRDYIIECVDGIINNTASDVIALVVDDGSTDGCGDLVEETYRDNPRVKLLRKPNGGCASARNYGRMLSDASHIAFVDADDVIDPEMFPQLLELARYTGAETVQAGFDFLHMEEGGAIRMEDSYEQAPEFTAQFKRNPFGKNEFCVIPNTALMIGQPTIWRRIYRRDFLDSRDVWFPEHIRAFDDQIFQMLTLFYAGAIPAIDHVRYHYRQHPGQDIKQGDERFFYSLEMFRSMVKRGIREGWNTFSSLLTSYVNTVNWIHGGLRPDLKPKFLQGAAQLWVLMQQSLGPFEFARLPDTVFAAEDFHFYAERYRASLKGSHILYSWIYLDAGEMHAPILKMQPPGRRESSNVLDAPEGSNTRDIALRVEGQLISRGSDFNQLPFESTDSLICLSPKLDTGDLFLDGIVAEADVGLAQSTEPPFSGTQWTLRSQLNGMWLLINQNDMQQCLGVKEGRLCLMPHHPGEAGLPTSWHILKKGRGFVIVCGQKHLLSSVDGAPAIVEMSGELDEIGALDTVTWWIRAHPADHAAT